MRNVLILLMLDHVQRKFFIEMQGRKYDFNMINHEIKKKLT